MWKIEPKTWYHKSFKRKYKKLFHIGFDDYSFEHNTQSIIKCKSKNQWPRVNQT